MMKNLNYEMKSHNYDSRNYIILSHNDLVKKSQFLDKSCNKPTKS